MADWKLSQKDRLFSLQGPFPAEGVLVRALEARESISSLYEYNFTLIADIPDLEPEDIVGQPATIGLKLADGSSQRYFSGYVSTFCQIEPEERFYLYEGTLVPWLWFLTLNSDCRIYQEKTVVEVAKDVFDRFGFRDYDDSGIRLKHEPWEYCTQYRESSFDFVSRLFEAEGIYYWFKHEAGRQTLILADHLSAHQDTPHQSEARYERSEGVGIFHAEDSISSWKPRKTVRPGKYTHDEFNFEQPKPRAKDLLRVETTTTKSKVVLSKYEVYDYPGEYEKRGEGEGYGRCRQESLEADHHVLEGESTIRALKPGFKIKMTGHYQAKQNDAYIVTEVVHSAHEGSVYIGDPKGGATYKNKFACIPATTQYRPPQKTEKHEIASIQTAIVVGPAGEEIYTDKYGRVKVQFHWDRLGKYDENSSCWMRPMQPWTGVSWGQIWIPRIGQEVVVGFLESDPDRPVILGCLYNEDLPVPYPLPKNMTRSGVKTRSSKNGGPQNFNELRFEDLKGEELVLLHAERDYDISVERDKNEKIERDRNEKVERHHTERVDGDYHLDIGGERRSETGGDDSLTVGGTLHIKAGQNVLIEAGQQIHLKAGSRLVIQAMGGVSVIGSSGHIDVGAAQVVIQGPMVHINSGMPHSGPGNPSSPAKPKAVELPSKMPRD